MNYREVSNVEDTTVYEEEYAEGTTEVDTEENGETMSEVRHNVEEVLDETEYENEIDTVSDSDSIVTYDEEFARIIEEIVAQRQQLDTLQEYIEYKDMKIFEKPLEDYTVTEGLLLTVLVVAVFGVVIKLIGGIITCKI